MFDPLMLMDDNWKFDVVVRRSAGRDYRGNPLPATQHVVAGCMFAPSSTNDNALFSDRAELKARLYAPVGSDIQSTDQIEIPYGGKYVVDGEPMVWPAGVECVLERA